MKKKYNLPKDFTVTYHAGFMRTEPNSIESIEKAIKMNAQIVEMDVTFRDDGTPVIIHASSAGKDKGASFDEALSVVAKHPTCKINLDIKSIANIPAIDKAVKSHGLENRAFYTGVGEDWVECVKANSTLPYFLNFYVKEEIATSEEKLKALANKIQTLGACGLNTDFSHVNKLTVDIMHYANLSVSVWTCNKKRHMKKMLSVAPDNITTKRPDRLNRLIG